MPSAVPNRSPSRLDLRFADAYRRRPGSARPRSTWVQAKHLLGAVAVRLRRYPYQPFTVDLMAGRSRLYAVVHGLIRGGYLGLLTPVTLLLALYGLMAIGGNSSPEPEDFAPNPDQIQYHFLDTPMGPVYWAVSWLLLFFRNTVWSSLAETHALGTDWDWILAILCLVITIRLLLLPLVAKQIRSQRHMRALQPKVKALQELHKGDREILQREMMELYRKEKANPLMGCLPIFVQVPVFFGLFHVVNRLEPGATDAEATRFGWSAADFHDATDARFLGVPITATTGAGGGLRVLLLVGMLVLVWMAIAYVNAYRPLVVNGGWSHDPQQRMIQRLIMYGMPVFQPVTVLFVPTGAVLYMLAQSGSALAQQAWIDRRYPPPRKPITALEPPDAVFGFTALMTFGAVVMVTYPIMAITLSGGWLSVVTLVVVGLALALAAALRELIAVSTGGAGPICARRFLDDACQRGILLRLGRRYRFCDDWLRDELAIDHVRAIAEYRRADRPTPSPRPADRDYATGRLLSPDEWSMNGAEHLDEFLYRKD